MARIFGILGTAVAVLYKILFDPSRQPAIEAGSTWDPQLLVMYGAAGFAIGWVIGFAFSRFGAGK